MRGRRGQRRYEVERTDEQWRDELAPQQYRVLRQAGTERAGSGAYAHDTPDGVFRCAACAAALFDSAAKYESGTGWPSFTAPTSPGAVELVRDFGLLVPRTEVRCARCGSHLGHVFRDGPAPTGRRYCMNSAALDLEPAAAAPGPKASAPGPAAVASGPATAVVGPAAEDERAGLPRTSDRA